MKEYIDREVFFRFLTEQKDKETGAYSKGRNVGLDVARSALKNREINPAADVAPVRHGRWIDVYISGQHHYRCSECGEYTEAIWHSNFVYAYCPNCGAKMDLEVT